MAGYHMQRHTRSQPTEAPTPPFTHTHHDTFPVHSDALLHDCPRSEHILADMVEVADTAIHSLMEVLLGGETGVASGHFEQLTTSPPGL